MVSRQCQIKHIVTKTSILGLAMSKTFECRARLLWRKYRSGFLLIGVFFSISVILPSSAQTGELPASAACRKWCHEPRTAGLCVRWTYLSSWSKTRWRASKRRSCYSSKPRRRLRIFGKWKNASDTAWILYCRHQKAPKKVQWLLILEEAHDSCTSMVEDMKSPCPGSAILSVSIQ